MTWPEPELELVPEPELELVPEPEPEVSVGDLLDILTGYFSLDRFGWLRVMLRREDKEGKERNGGRVGSITVSKNHGLWKEAACP